MEHNHTPKLFTWRQGVIVLLAASCGAGLNAYRTYRTRGTLDSTWFVIAVITLAIMGAIFFFIARHGNRPEKED